MNESMYSCICIHMHIHVPHIQYVLDTSICTGMQRLYLRELIKHGKLLKLDTINPATRSLVVCGRVLLEVLVAMPEVSRPANGTLNSDQVVTLPVFSCLSHVSSSELLILTVAGLN